MDGTCARRASGRRPSWRWHVPLGARRPALVEPVDAATPTARNRGLRRAAARARRSGKPGEARTALESLVRSLVATPEDLELSALDALAAGDASDGTVDLATRAVFATGRRDADALRTLALVRAARGELARARALEVEATALEPQAPPDALARLGEAWTRDALGFPIGTEDVGKSLLASGPFADAVRNLAARVPRAVAVQRPKR